MAKQRTIEQKRAEGGSNRLFDKTRGNVMTEQQTTEEVRLLRRYLAGEPTVALGFLHGSFAKGSSMEESDIDVAVYLRNGDQEDRIWRDMTVLLKKEVDLLSLNNAPATLVSNVLKTGIPLIVRDRNLYWRLYLGMSTEAEDFLGFVKSYRDIFLRSKSLAPEDKARLLERVQFLEEELSDIEKFRQMSFEEYESERSKRRDIERWSENIINAAIDIAKIILASEKKTMPRTYEEALRQFATFAGLGREEAEQFSGFARLRNILAHEYLDILYGRIRDFINVFPKLYNDVSGFLKSYIDKSVS